MIKKSEIIKMAGQILEHRQGVPNESTAHPGRDCLIGFSVALVIVFGGALYATQLFLAHQERPGPATDASPHLSYDREAVGGAIDLFTRRAAHFETLKNTLPSEI